MIPDTDPVEETDIPDEDEDEDEEDGPAIEFWDDDWPTL